MDSLNAIIPLFALIGFGYLAKRTLLDSAMLPALNQFVYFFAVPALLFQASSSQSLESLLDPIGLTGFLFATILTGLLTVVLCRVLFQKQDFSSSVIQALNTTFANYAYMGIPLIFALLGEEAQGATISIILTGNLFLIGGAQLLIESQSKEHVGWKHIVSVIDRSLLRNPIFIATVLGLTVSSLDLTLPQVVTTTLDTLGQAAIPVALFCLGASLQFMHGQTPYRELFFLSAIKLLIHPALTWGVFILLGMQDSIWLIVSVLLTALPTGVLAHVVAMKYDIMEKATSQVVVISTLFSLVTVSVWVNFLEV